MEERMAKEIRRKRGFEVWMVMKRDKNGLFYPAHALGTRQQARDFIARQNSYPLLKCEMYVQKYGPYR
jgi:hypothetical protein